MDEGKSWLRTNWRTAVVLVLIFGLALFLRVYFVAGVAFNSSALDCTDIYTPQYSGGSDSYYWDRALCYSLQSGRDLGTDPMLAYPIAMPNPRPPLFPWFSLLVGRLFAPLFATPWDAVYFTFLLSTGLFGALTVFPTYALGKEAFGRKAGLIAALLLAISVGHLQRSPSTNADHDAFTLFFVVSTFYFFLRGLKTLNRRRWVENWFRRDLIVSGLRSFFRENRTSVLYALLSGLCLAVIALAWQGWAYVMVILLVWFAAELFLDRFRNEDTMGTWLLFAIALATPVLIAFQWYYVRGQIRVWFDVPAYLFFAAVVLGLAFTVTREYPWTLVIPSTLIAGAAGLGVGALVNPTLANAFFTGAGYFIQAKVVTTIAEDQAPGMSQIILSFGLFTFGVSLVAIAYLLWQIPRRRDPAYSLVVIWAFAAIFMAITAARFIFNASPAFAITAGFGVDQVLKRADFAGMRRTYRSLAGGSWRNAVRKSVKPRHILAAFGIIGLVLLPNVWWAVDASIPFELKTQYDRQIAALLPAFLQAPGYNPSSQSPFYFGAFGYNIPKPTDYYPAAWQWFATQDANLPPELRPAFLSWWDYGFEAVDRGLHPTVADNFQNGYPIAGQFITAQNETQGIALLSVRLLEGDFRHNRQDFRPAVKASLVSTGLPVETFRSVFLRPQDYVSVILSDPVTYGAWDRDMQPLNAQYIYLTSIITRRLSEEGVVSLYHAIRDATGWEIGYFAVDSRLFPISVQNTGIFYAPVKLSDHRVVELPDGRVLPFEFFQIFANTTRGNNIPIQFLRPDDQIQTQFIQYQAAFYDSMFYRAYIGYSPSDLGFAGGTGIPGISQGLQGFPPVPAWNLTHWRAVYRTSYYNPFPDVGNHTDAFQAMNYDEALRRQADITAGKIKGVVDLSTQSSVANGVVFLRYYDGAWVNGTVWADAVPLPSVRITVTDELGTPHYVTTTDAEGHYSALVPFGTITITVSVGNAIRTTLIGPRTLASATIPVTVDQAMRASVDSNGDTIPDWVMTRDFHVRAHTAQGTAFFDLNRNGVFGSGDLRAAGVAITVAHKDFAYSRSATSNLDGTYSIAGLPEGQYSVRIAASGRTLIASDLNIATTDSPRDMAVPFALVRGVSSAISGDPVPSAMVEFRDETNRTIISVLSQSDGSYRVGPLLSGNYTVSASSGDLASTPTRIRPTDTNVTLNLTLMPSGTVTGTTIVFGTAKPFASLDFQSATDPRTVRTTTSDAIARYSIRLPAGDWFVNGRFYDSTGLYATLDRVVVEAGVTTNHDAIFLDGIRVTGTVKDSNPSVRSPEATVAFSNIAGELWVRTDALGGYLGFLPAGAYDLEAFNQDGGYYAAVSLPVSRRIDISLVATSETVGWTVFRDLNGNASADVGEGIAGARVNLIDILGARVGLTTNETGAFQIPLFGNRTYSGTVSATGYVTRTISSASPSDLRAMMPLSLTPLLVQVVGTVLLNGSAFVNRPITVRAEPLGNGAAAATTATENGGFGLGLLPGTYALVVDENVSSTRDVRYQNRGEDRIVLTVGQSLFSHDIQIVARARTVGNVTLNGSAVAATVVFSGPDARIVNATTSGFEVYLVPGTYAVTGSRSIPPNHYTFMTTTTIPSPTNLSFSLMIATQVTGQVLSAGAVVPGPMPIAFVREEGGAVSVTTDDAGAYTAFVVPGNFSVSLASSGAVTEGGVPRYYRYEFDGNVSIPPNQALLNFDLSTSRSLDNTTASGTVTMAGVGLDAVVTFTARGGGAISAQATAGPNGAYTVSLAPGTYDGYATRAGGTAAFLARITVPHAADFVQDVRLSNAFFLAGVTTNPEGARTSASISIATDAVLDVTSDGSGGYQVSLPPGAYTITATKTGVENGIAVTYRAVTYAVLTADTIVNLPLAKVVSRSASLVWDASQRREIAAGGSVAYTIVVRNTGNVADTFTLAGSPADWQFSFSPASITLNFGNAANSSFVRVTIQSPANALVDHGSIQILARTSADGVTVGTVDVQVDIQRVRGLAVSLDASSAVFDGRVLRYTLLVMNSGNAQETVNVAITNPDDLGAAGWSVKLGTTDGPTTGPTLTSVAVGANQTVKVRLEAQPTGGSSGANVVLLVSPPDSTTVSATGIFTLQLPQLATGEVVVNGPDITRAAPLNLQLIAIVAGAIAAIGVGLFLTRRRR